MMKPAQPTSHEAQPIVQPRDRVLFEGDSLTDGLKNPYSRIMGWDLTWAHHVADWLFTHRPDLNLETVNLAVGGSSAQNLLTRVEAAVAFDPTVVFFTIGTNEALTRIPLDEFKEKLAAWCEPLGRAGCRTFVLVGGFVPFPNVDDATRADLERCKPYWAAAQEVIAPRGGVYIDVGPYVLARAQALDARWPQHTVYSCGVHYNTLGNQLIAGAVLTHLGFWAQASGSRQPA